MLEMYSDTLEAISLSKASLMPPKWHAEIIEALSITEGDLSPYFPEERSIKTKVSSLKISSASWRHGQVLECFDLLSEIQWLCSSI